jgi:hypothetical protein
MVSVRRVGIPPGQAPPSSGTDVTAEDADSAGAAMMEPELVDLPTRTVRHHLPLQRLRFMDDPEILERVLQGLINLT